MTKSPRKNVHDVGIELGAACMASGHASDRATVPGNDKVEKVTKIKARIISKPHTYLQTIEKTCAKFQKDQYKIV